MTSPYPLAIGVEMFYDDAWHAITVDTRQTSDIEMKWGRADEASAAAPNELRGITLNNGQSRVNPAVSGRYSLRNPRSDLFGKISRNTPIRVRLGDPRGEMVLSGRDDTYASTPDVAALDVTGDIDLRFDAAVNWNAGTTGGTGIGIARKYDVSGNQRSWALFTSPNDQLQFAWSPDGTLASRLTATSTAVIPAASGERLAVRVTLDVNNGAGGNTTTFYTAPTIDGPWTQLGATTVGAGTTSIHSGTADLEVGRCHGSDSSGVISTPIDGSVYAFQMRSGIGGAVVAEADFLTRDSGVDVVFTDDAGRVWTLTGYTYIDDRSVRMVGEITDMPTEWDSTGNDVWVPVRAKSITRRLGQGESPLRSSLYRDLSTSATTVAYWSMEDGADATTVAPAIGNQRLAVTGDVNMAGYTGFAGSDAVPEFGNVAHISGSVPAYVPNARQRVACMLHQDPDQPADRNLIYTTCAGGTITEAILVLKADGSLRIVMRDIDSTNVLDFSGGVGDLRDENAMVWMLFTQVGANIDWQIGKIAEGEGVVTFHSGTLNGYTYGRFTTIRLGAAGELSGTAIGHVHIANGNDDAGFWSTAFTSLVAWDGETAGERIARLCAEQNVPLVVVGEPSNTVRMGKQGIESLLDLLRKCAEADLGVLDDHTRILAKRYRTRESLYDQDVRLTINYAAGEPVPPLRPVPDDQATRNDVTVTRHGGSSARSVQETGPLNVQDPTADPQGVGRYDDDKTLILHSDSQATDQAGWRRHLGTVDEDRYPSIKVNLGRDPHLTEAVENTDPGDRMQIINPPAWLPAAAIDQIVQGGSETLHPYRHEVDFVCTPASPWVVASVSDGTDEQRIDALWSTTDASFDSGTDTALSVATSQGPLWTTDATQLPLEIQVSGVVLEVTAISGATSPQTFTVTQTPVNGVEKTIPVGSDVVLSVPPIIGL